MYLQGEIKCARGWIWRIFEIGSQSGFHRLASGASVAIGSHSGFHRLMAATTVAAGAAVVKEGDGRKITLAAG